MYYLINFFKFFSYIFKVDWDEKSAQLAWDPPINDGGAPIEDYVVEKKSKHDRDWKECARVGKGF